MLQRGEASAVMTKLVNDSSGYLAAYAAMASFCYLIQKKGDLLASNVATLVGFLCSMTLFFYWVGHVVSMCQELKDKHEDSKAAIFHSVLILFIFLLGYPTIIAVTIWTVLQSIK
ncbi:MAG: hypothetical protein G3W58_02065 [Pantoea ananatis]|nr:hypothetical protein [Pantoea ananatis]